MRALLIFGLAAVFARGVAPSAMLDSVEPEDQLKAATVLAILQNSTWAAQEGEGPVTVGVWGRPAMTEALRRILEGRTVNGRATQVIAVTGGLDAGCCRVLYIASGRKGDLQKLIPAAAAAHMVTIGEDDRFLDLGGALNLYIADGHMAFEVSLAALERCRVTISSRLLRFGRVRDTAKEKAP